MSDLTNLQAYELLLTEELKDIQSVGYLYRHKKSGAKVVVFSNTDDNKVFSIGFRTTPDDETGVPHIIEHTTLCGSAKYPLKDPFVDLVKGSLNTFLNAMTYPDKTVYPIASYNDQDFKNLMDVYLDAVFSPMLLKEEKIFKQEGWHYEMEDASSDLTITGVVYNEMKGAYSSSDEILSTETFKSLFPDNTYSQNSGGNPAKIPELTYEKYLEFYHTYYHPSNSYIYLYGDMDVEERLNYLDQEYLCKYDALEMHTEIIPQKAFEKQIRVEKEYPVASDDPTENATMLSYNWCIGSGLDPVRYLAVDIIDYALISAPGAPLMKALLDAGIGEDVYSSYETGMCQGYYSIIARGANPEDEDKFVEIVEQVIREQVEKGLDESSLLASINSAEFRYREADFGRFPKGLMYGLQMMDSWLYDDMAPFMFFHALDTYADLKQKIGTDYYEKLLRELLLDNTHSSLVVLKPNQGMNIREEEKLKEQLATLKAKMSPEEIETIIRETKELHEYQETPSDEAAKECLPQLQRSDLRKATMPLTNIETEVNGVKVVRHDYETTGIDYMTMYFDVDDTDMEDVSALSLLSNLLGMLDTNRRSYLEYSNEVNIYTGGISTTASMYRNADENKSNFKFIVRGKSLEENFEKMLALISEMLFETKFDDEKRVSECIMQIKSRLQMDLSSSGHMTASTRAAANFSLSAALQDRMHGVEFYRYICKTEKEVKENPAAFAEKMQAMLTRILAADRLVIGFTSNEEVYQRAASRIQTFLEQLPATSDKGGGLKFEPGNRKEAFTDASQIQYVSRAGNFLANGFEYTGYLRILKMILSYDYLWTNVRVKGGAYGCSGNFTRGGEATFASYRDPNLAKTNEIYEGIPAYLEAFSPDEREMTGYVIGTFGMMDTPMSPDAKGSRSMNAYFTGVSYDQLQKERTEILNATAADIRGLAPLVKAVLADGHFCVVGNENNIHASKDMFTDIHKLCE